MREVETWKKQQHNLQAIVDPKDNISNASKSSSKASSKSSSARIAATEKATMEALSKALPAMHTLQFEEGVLKSKREQMEIQVQLAAAAAGLKVLSDNVNIRVTQQTCTMRDVSMFLRNQLLLMPQPPNLLMLLQDQKHHYRNLLSTLAQAQ